MAKKKATLPNDYERMVPEYHKGTGVYGEHIARYIAAQETVRGSTVLDIASGSGYGTAILAKYAKHVTGVDVSQESVDYSKEHYSGKNIDYIKSDGTDIPVKDKSLDVITSFETIEHIDDYKHFMSECKRVLKKDGIFLLSTPNDQEFAEGNHFHIHEFEHDELIKLVKKYFNNVELYYQATWTCNLIGEEEMMSNEWESATDFMQTAPIEPKKFLYFYFLCSDRKITEKIKSRGVIGEHWSERKKVEAESKQMLTDQHVHNLEAKIQGLEDELAQIKSTKPYKFSKKISKTRELISKRKK
jgi:ubiquinone/menaquinone biosynthesis C-methylase UbiE